MKLHYKEWPSVALTADAVSSVEVDRIPTEILSPNSGRWHVWDSTINLERLYLFRSRNRYFQFGGNDEELAEYFEDIVYPRVAYRSKVRFIEYPIYSLARKFGRKVAVVVSAPYAGLLAEIFSKSMQRIDQRGFSFIRPRIGRVYEMARQTEEPKSTKEALSPGRKSIVFRGGRLTLNLEDQVKPERQVEAIRSLVLVGENILQSELFRTLVREGFHKLKFKVDDSLAKVAFKHGTAMGVVVRLDRFGNYHFRPGFGGKNLDSFLDLLDFCESGAATDEARVAPFGRVLEAGF